jgi:succinate dehydrogenase/fumarate reductase flavoprotein subunit
MMENWTDEFDVVCVGSGIGGLAAATVTAGAGLRTLIVEKTPFVGGVTAFSGGQIWSPGNKYQAAAGIQDSVSAGIEYVENLAGAWRNPKMTTNLFMVANKAIEFYEQQGVPFRMMPGIPDYFYPEVPGSKENGRYLDTEACALSSLGEWADHMRLNRSASKTEMAGISGRVGDERHNDTLVAGEALAAHFVRAALAAGAEIRIDSPAIRLIAEGGHIVGVSIATASGTCSVRGARGVLLATGGYDHNKKLLSRFEGNFEPCGTLSPPGVTGDHLIMGGDVGAAITVLPPVRAAVTNGLFTDSLDDCGDRITTLYWPVGPHEIVVNSAGDRFADETFYPEIHASVHTFDHKSHSHPNWPMWLIFDDDYWSSAVRSQQAGPIRSDCVIADTLENLAEKAGIDPIGLRKTVDRYNAMCANGRDQDFRRGERPWLLATLAMAPTGESVLGPIRRPPFYATKLLQAHVDVPSAGLEINEDAEVLMLDGRKIPGLYAAGNAAGRSDIGASLQSGIANLRGMVYGYLAGQHMSTLSTATPTPE